VTNQDRGVGREPVPVVSRQLSEGPVQGFAGDLNEAGGAGEAADGIAGTLPELVDQFLPGVTIHLLGHDAEIDADIDEDGADWAVTDLVGNFLGRGQAGEIAGGCSPAPGGQGRRAGGPL
jgi:hypothetical protein